jgi:Predicted membrane protein (DUF2157)
MNTQHGIEATPGELLDRWVARGLLSRDQAESIRAEEGWGAPGSIPRAVPAGHRASLISEALGYLGGILIVVAASLIGTWYWSDIPTWARLGIPIMAAVALFGAGWAAARRPSALTARLRAVLWLGSVAAVAFAWWVVGHDLIGLTSEQDLGLLVGLGTAPFAAVLWVMAPTFLQQAAAFVALVAAAAAAAARLPEGDGAPGGVAVWGLGVVWLVLGWGRMLPPWRGAYALGAVGCLAGGLSTIEAGDWGYVFALVTVAALVGVAVLLRELIILGVAAVGALTVLPASVLHFFPGELAAPLALLLAGALLVLAGLRAARQRSRWRQAPGTGSRAGSRPLAIVIAGGAAVGATVVVLALGLAN